MPFVVYSVTTVIDSNQWHSSDETRDTDRTLYSTLKSANRAARQWAKDNKGEDDDDDEGTYSGDGCYSESWDASKYESYSVEVEAEEVFGPDLRKGEQDEPDSDDEDDDGNSEEESDGQSSEVEIVEPPAKRKRSGAE
jgi:hypothetical protein